MIIGTVRPEEARVFDSHAGFHKFHADETQEAYGSFEVFWFESVHVNPGWYWAAGFEGCLYDSEPCGPFASSQQAHEDADEWAPEYDV